MKNFTHTVTVENGLHARPAGQVVAFAKSLSSDVTISAKGKSADLKKLFSLMKLDIQKGEVITVSLEGEHEESDCQALETYCQQNM
ncbi:HPr family phosphocarrier protein [Parasphaerochaeta coccoides]|uniref:Phosphocarrier protein HPr n=1 Tax=Parasphaerochaeta coccoides (strain ATCC BAA-1237 / DSM 17374 / SPN1) TaxID=760011 RepID=F4GIU4_PARC1|nr:HPr family phosphocarrier protein [Parasphaerochaeta coccoides]AEC02712.1 Phosphotransferase system, phosphocarrier protein HPr [Parasphaerochaeta coccoides DSM 17374]